MKTEQPPVIRLSDYAPPRISVESVDLGFDLAPSGTQVAATLRIARTDGTTDPIFLEGEALRLLEIEIDGAALSEDSYKQSETGLTLLNAPDAFTLRTVVSIDPADNTAWKACISPTASIARNARRKASAASPSFPTDPM